MKTEQTKNKIIIYTGSFESKKQIVLYDFKKVDHICIDHVAYLRILCGNRYYYYKVCETTIGEIEIYE